MASADNALLFVEIAQRGSIAAAARVFGITRATAARRLSALEAHLGVQLVQRTTRMLSLTSAGRAFLAHALDARAALERAEDAAMHIVGAPSGLLRIAAPIINIDRLFAPLLVAFDQEYTDIDIELVLAADVRRLVAQGFDVGLQIGLDANAELAMRQLLSTEMILVGSPEYLRREGIPTNIEELGSHSCLMVRSLDGDVIAWQTTDERQFVPPRIKLLSNSEDIVIVGARSGLGLAMATRELCQPDLDAGRLIQVMPHLVGYHEWFSIVYSATRIMPPKVRVFIDFTVEYTNDLIADGLQHEPHRNAT